MTLYKQYFGMFADLRDHLDHRFNVAALIPGGQANGASLGWLTLLGIGQQPSNHDIGAGQTIDHRKKPHGGVDNSPEAEGVDGGKQLVLQLDHLDTSGVEKGL